MQTQPVDSKPLPPVERVRPGLWSIPVPLPIVLRYVLVYAFRDRSRALHRRRGMEHRRCLRRAELRLGQQASTIADVQGVMVTHIHPDHYGLAGRIRETSGAWIAHPADARSSTIANEEPDDLLERMGAYLRRLGAPDARSRGLRDASMPARRS